jgi:regulator of protease activity HflC (stomatin/prohibitin superfamily)
MTNRLPIISSPRGHPVAALFVGLRGQCSASRRSSSASVRSRRQDRARHLLQAAVRLHGRRPRPDVEKQALRFDLDNIRVQVSGGKFYDVDAFVIYRISDARRFRETVSGDRESAEARLRTQSRFIAAPRLRSA